MRDLLNEVTGGPSLRVDPKIADGAISSRLGYAFLCRNRAIRRNVVSVAILATWLVGLTLLSAFDARAETVRIELTNPSVPSKAVELNVQKEFVSSRNAAELRAGRRDTESLYLVFRYVPQSESPVSTASPRDLREGAPGLTHIFLNIPVRPPSEDIGQWYLDTFVKDAKRTKTYREAEGIAPGVLKYDFSGTSNDIVFTYKDTHSKTVAIECFVHICQGYKTWNAIVHVSYWYQRIGSERTDLAHFREVDDFIDQILSDNGNKSTK